MSKQYTGGLITKSPVTPSGPYETSTASGIWTLDQQAYWRKLNQWPIAGSPVPDPQFNYVTMLLHGDGTNGAQNNTFLDSSTNAFSITRNGNTTQGSFSPYGSNWSNYFNGTTAYLQFANNSAFDFGSGDFTIEFWMNASTLETGTLQPIINKGTDYSSEYAPFDISRDGTAVQLWLGTAGPTWGIVGGATIGTIVIGQWSHFAVTRSGTTFKAFQNGVQTWTTTSSLALLVSTFPLRLSATSNAGSFFNGYLSNVRLVKGTAVYTSAFTPSTTPLTAISGTSLLTCQSNRFVDNSSNAFTVTVVGAPSVQRFNPFGTATAYSTSVIGGSGFFDGSGDYLTASATNIANFGTGDFIVSAWFNSSTTTGNQKIFDNYNGNNNSNPSLILNLGGAGTANWYAGQTAVITSSSTYIPNTWNYVVVSRVSSTTKMFLNGTQVGSVSDTRTYAAGYTTVGIGGEPYSSGGAPFPGYITDLQVVKGSGVTSSTVPTAPVSASGTTLALSFQNGAIYDNAMITGLETVGNAQISTSVKKFGTGSMYFDGTGDYLVGNGGQGLGGDFTIEAWVYAVAFTGDARVIVDTRDVWSTSAGLNFYFNDTGNLIMYVNGGDRITSATAYSTATWYFVTLARSGSTITMYVNGTSVGTYTYSTALTDKSITIGTAIDNRSTGTAWHFNGYIDDLRITKGYARYTANFTAPTAAFPNIGPT